MSDRKRAGRILDDRGESREGCPVADTSLPAKTPPKSPVKRGSGQAKRHKSESRLVWQQVNSVTWRLVDPNGPSIRVLASHGQWGGYDTPKAVAWVFDVGIGNNHDWRARIRQRGGWRAFGSVIDADLAKRIAQQAVENPSEPRPCKYSMPLNVLGGYRWPDAHELDPQTRAYVRDVEIEAVKVESPNEPYQATLDDVSINVSAPDDDSCRLARLGPSHEWPDHPSPAPVGPPNGSHHSGAEVEGE